jgi:anthranilate/para-aminobenzoate synthase component I
MLHRLYPGHLGRGVLINETSTIRETSDVTSKRQKTAKHQPTAASPFKVAALWPHQEGPLLLSKVGGSQIFIATSFSPVDFETLSKSKPDDWLGSSDDSENLSTIPRWMFLLPYEAYNHDSTLAGYADRPLAWEIHAGLVWENDADNPAYVATSAAASARFHFDYKTKLTPLIKDASKYAHATVKPLVLTPTTSDDSYIDAASNLIRSIANGDFYQINLLRFFHAAQPHNWQNLCALMEANSGPQGVLISVGNKIVASFSPERFIEIIRNSNGLEISTWPIKGTAPRCLNDELKDRQIGTSLSNSRKDLAELQMIIDLMRNDFARICRPGTVQVKDQGSLKKFFQVWHLEGHVSGDLDPSHDLSSLLAAVCPGGSITGAPKVAVMNRIRQEEGRLRGYFMGNFFRINRDGSLQSNIMIRTLISENWLRSAMYAAGSGLVIKSEPNKEMLEIRTKCAPVTLTSKQTKDREIVQSEDDYV